MNKRLRTTIYAILGMLPFCLVAKTTDLPMQMDGPIQIESDQVIFEQNTGAITYQGNVIVSSADQKLTANKVIVKRDSNQAIASIQAFGSPAHYLHQTEGQPTIHAYAKHIDYQPNHSLLTLVGKAKIIHAQDTFEGPILKYAIDEQKIEARQSKNERPKMIINPTTVNKEQRPHG